MRWIIGFWEWTNKNQWGRIWVYSAEAPHDNVHVCESAWQRKSWREEMNRVRKSMRRLTDFLLFSFFFFFYITHRHAHTQRGGGRGCSLFDFSTGYPADSNSNCVCVCVCVSLNIDLDLKDAVLCNPPPRQGSQLVRVVKHVTTCRVEAVTLTTYFLCQTVNWTEYHRV